VFAAAACAQNFSERDAIIVAFSNKLWKIYADGQIDSLSIPLPSQPSSGRSGIGSTRPAPAPDMSVIALIADYNLWLYELDSSQLSKLTSVGQPYNEDFLAVKTYITGWSPNSQFLLYAIAPGIAGDDGPVMKREVAYGHYVFDQRTFVHTKVTFPKIYNHTSMSLPATFQTWLSDDSVLLQARNPRTEWELFKFSLSTQTTELLATFHFEVQAVDVSKNGLWMLAKAVDWRKRRCRIVRIDLKTSKLMPMTEWARWAEIQHVALSPDDSKFSYVVRVPSSSEGRYNFRVKIEDTVLHESQSHCLVNWIRHDRVAIMSNEEITILNVPTRELLATYHLD